jgi:hypothetical protein
MKQPKRTRFVGVKFTDEEHKELERLSRYTKQSVSQVVRDLINTGLNA